MKKFLLDPNFVSDEHFFDALETDGLSSLAASSININKANSGLKFKSTKQTQSPSMDATGSESGSQQTPFSQWQSLIAKVASGFRKGRCIGNVGVAVLKNPDDVLKLILYRTKAKVLAVASLNTRAESTQIYKREQYLQFYDDQNVYWSLKFDQLKDEQNFVQILKENNVEIDEIAAQGEHNTLAAIFSTTKTATLTAQANISSTAEQELQKLEEQQSEAASIECSELPTQSSTPDNDELKQAKSALITRMAKMGLQLPVLNEQQHKQKRCSESSDAGDAELLDITAKPAVMPRASGTFAIQSCMQFNTPTAPSASSTTSNIYNQLETHYLRMLLTENRTQNTEMRINLGKLESKVERVLEKITCMSPKASQEDEILNLEEQQLLLKKENRNLRQELKSLHENFNLNDSIKSKLADLDMRLETEKPFLINQVFNDVLDKALNYRAQADKSAQENSMLQADLNAERERVTSAKKLADEQQQQLQALQAALEAEQQKSITASAKIKEMDDNNAKLQQAIEERIEMLRMENEKLKQNKEQIPEPTALPRRQSETDFMVKSIMNNLMGSLSTQLEQEESIEKQQVLALIGKTIRTETLKAIEQVHQDESIAKK